MKQQERRVATRTVIINAAEQLFANRGIKAATIDDIVALMPLSRPDLIVRWIAA
jgi:AcrR family transcriptional regulator